MKKGNLVVFRHKSGLKAAVALDLQGKTSWKVEDERGQSYVVGEKEVALALEGTSLVPGDLGPLLARSREIQESLDLPTAWELLEGQGSTTLEDIGALLFDTLGTPERLALWLGLEAERIYFKAKGAVYEVRNPQQVADLRHAAEAEEARQKAWGAFAERWQAYEAASKGGNVHGAPLLAGSARQAPHPDDIPRFQALEDFALYGEEARQKNPALKVLDALDIKGSPEMALQALIRAGWWDRHVLPGVLRRGYRQDFDPALASEAEALGRSSIEGTKDPLPREDFTGHRVITIDSESTTEVDDGLSVARDAEGHHWVWVHIADPDHWIPQGSSLDQEARQRATTVYLPQETFPMIPPAISSGVASLNVGQTTAALSFGAWLQDDGSLGGWRISPSWVRPALRLDYHAAAALLGDSSLSADTPPPPVSTDDLATLQALWDLVRTRQAWRTTQGAVNLQGREVDLKVVDGVPHLEPVPNDRARQVVSECMILAGEIAGRYGQDQGLLLPYRYQEAPTFDHALLESLPEGLVRDYHKRRFMPKGRTALEAAPHASLGLPAYVQVTSPLRRYNDLMAQRAIKARLAGAPDPLDREGWETLLAHSLDAMAEAGRCEGEAKRYWALEYLRIHQKQSWEALVLAPGQEKESPTIILITEPGLEWAWKTGRQFKPGQVLSLRLKPDPRAERLVVDEA